MALTDLKHIAGPMPVGDRWLTVTRIDFDSSYSAGGEALTLVQLGFAKDPDWVEIVPRAGFSFEYDVTNKKVKVLAPVKRYTATHDAASLASDASRDDAITVTGVAATDRVVAAHLPDAALAGITIQNARVTALDTITVRLTNTSALAVDLASGSFVFYVVKANGAAQEVPDTTDLSALTDVLVKAYGQHAA